MAKPARMTKQVKAMVTLTNDYCKAQHIKDIYNPMFDVTGRLLIAANCYHGFNYYTVDGKLSGGDNEKFDHLEYYIW